MGLKHLNALGLPEHRANTALMYLQMEEHLEAINLPLRVRKGHLELRFDKHTPQLLVAANGQKPEVVASVDTRQRGNRIVVWPCTIEENRLLWDHIQELLAKQNAYLALTYEVTPTGKRRVNLQLASEFSRTLRHTLWYTDRKEPAKKLTSFTPPKDYWEKV